MTWQKNSRKTQATKLPKKGRIRGRKAKDQHFSPWGK